RPVSDRSAVIPVVEHSRLVNPLTDLLVGFALWNAVARPNVVGELVAVPTDLLEIILGELVPLRQDAAAQLLPILLDQIPAHLPAPESGAVSTTPLPAGFPR